MLFCMHINHSHAQTTPEGNELLKKIQARLSAETGEFALAFRDLQTKEQILWNDRTSFHAASTMKTPVMVEVFKQVAAGKLSLTDSLVVKNEFKSIVDGSLYTLDPADDSEFELYRLVGTKVTLYDLVYQMIILSSNLATNMVIELVDGKKVTQTMRELGAKDMQVLRGVEDGKAFEKGLNNSVTAYDLMILYQALAAGTIVNSKACEDMIRILLDQRYNDIIPAYLPKELKVAHKTGSITGVHHDSGIIFLPDGRKYVLVILSRKLADADKATEAMARVSEMIYRYMAAKK
ncbi:MAG: serine hydrolase [Chitinophagaceae bacterium]|nr:MAG: serine hydrolase [Chitinophagaceae bacterium]